MDEFNTNDAYPKILAVHLTTAARGSYPWEVALPKGAANLPSRSTAKCGEVYTLLKDQLQERIGTLSRDDMKRIDAALRVALSLDRE